MSHKIITYGWIPDFPDHRDLLFPKLTHSETIAVLPSLIDLSKEKAMPPVYDQGELGSCTGNAIAAAVQYIQTIRKPAWRFSPSRLFIYFNERVMEGTVGSDAGAMIRDGIKSVNSQGVCREDLWPYDITKFTMQPTQEAYHNATLHRCVNYQRVPQDLNTSKQVLASGVPIVFGFSVYNSFESDEVAKTGVVPMPGKDESVIGGHAVMIVGYNDATQTFLVRNSWGPDWGLAGYFTIPYAYVMDANLADDFWAINTLASA